MQPTFWAIVLVYVPITFLVEIPADLSFYRLLRLVVRILVRCLALVVWILVRCLTLAEALRGGLTLSRILFA